MVMQVRRTHGLLLQINKPACTGFNSAIKKKLEKSFHLAFLYPWAVTLDKIGWPGFWAMGIFLLLLLIGFVFEWKKGALEWE